MKEVKQSNWFAPYGEQTGKGGALAESPLKKKVKGLLALGLCLCLGLGLLPASAQAADPTTSWTDTGNFDASWYNATDTEFTLTTAAELAGLASLVNGGNDFSGKTVKLGADIDLSAHLWTPIGNDLKAFKGAFDGGGRVIDGLTVEDDTPNQYIGFLGFLGANGSVRSLRIRDASISVSVNDANSAEKIGILVGEINGAVSDCAVSGSIQYQRTGGNGGSARIGGLVGLDSSSEAPIKNCSVHLKTLNVSVEDSSADKSYFVGGVTGAGRAENCFADVDHFTVSEGAGTNGKVVQYAVGLDNSYSYWDASTRLTDSTGATFPAVYTESYAVSEEQIAGTGGAAIGQAGDKYANTNSLLTALNGWVAANAGHGDWSLKGGAPMLTAFVPNYIDIGVVPEQNKDSATGTLDADVQLHGQVQENVQLLSVTLPATIPFILDVDNAGALNRVLSGTVTLTNRSDMGVTVTLTSVTDPDSLLTKADLSLVPDPVPASGNVALTVGINKTDVLSTLAAQSGGVPATSTLKVDGAAKGGVASVGGDGDSFTLGLTLKVSKT